MHKKLLFSFFMCVIFKTLLIESATNTYNLGQNRVEVTTGPQTCCNGRVTDVTRSVRAVLHQKSNTRTTFGSSFDRRMTELDKVAGDHKGHILASVFGGPAQTWNLAPQADNVNIRLNSKNSMLVGWYECEKWIQKELESGQNLPVRVDISLAYASGNCRPTHWSISARNSNPRDPGCQALNIVNGFGGSFAVCTRRNG